MQIWSEVSIITMVDQVFSNKLLNYVWTWSSQKRYVGSLSNIMISQKTYSKGLPFAYLKKEKMIFLKIDKNTTLQRRFLHHKIQLILKFYLD